MAEVPAEFDKEYSFIKRKFSQYYAKAQMNFPDEVGQREWGFGNWDKKIEFRHYKFVSGTALQAYLSAEAPLYVSYSVAYYDEADARPIEKKGWKGAEVVFDFDADHFDLPCIRQHGKGWVCDECLSMVKLHAQRLVNDFLIPDFGVPEEDIEVKFSGNRGYHVHVKSQSMRRLGSYGRREMLDYVSGTGLDFDQMFRKDGAKLLGPSPQDAGWKGKIATYAVERDLTGVLPRTIVTHTEKLDAFRRGVMKGNWDAVRVPKKEDVWRSFVAGLGLQLGGEVDKQVTGDVTKLIRAPDTLHGETGLIAKKLKFKDLAKFDPLRDAVAFDGKAEVEVAVKEAPKIRFGAEMFGPFHGEKVKLPEKVAMYLLCKKQARLV